MLNISLLIVIIIIVILGVFLIRNIRRRNASRIIYNQSQIKTDEIVNRCLRQLAKQFDFTEKDSFYTGTSVADAWGRLVLVFNYQIPIENSNNFTLQTFKEKFSSMLQQDSANEQSNLIKAPQYVLTDFWSTKNVIQIDVARIINEPTADYVRDIKKLKK